MKRFAKIFGHRVLPILALALLLPALLVAGEKTPGPPSPGTKIAAPAAAAGPAKPVVPPAEAPPVPQAPAAPRAPAGEPEADESDEATSDIDGPTGGDKVVIWSDVEVGAGQEVPGSVVCIGGHVKILGKVHRDVVVIGGNLEMSGEADGAVVGVGSKLVLRSSARIGRDLVNVAGGLDRGGASVGGQVVNIGLGGWMAHLPGPFGILGFIFFWFKLLKLVLVFIAVLLIVALVPDRIRLISEEAPLHPFMAFFAGLGGFIVLAITMILLCITLIGIPAAVLLYFAFIVIKWMGLCGLFHIVGKKIGKLMGRDLSLLGATLLGFLPFAVLNFLPFCIGSMIWFVLEAMGVGLVILTRGGGRRYAATSTSSAAAPAAPPPPPPLAP